MKIAYFTDTYEPQINGVVTSIKLFKEELEKLGHTVYIFCPNPKTKDSKERKNVFYLPSLKYKLYPECRIAIPNLRAVREFKKIRPDIVHVQTHAPTGMLGIALAKRHKLPIIMTYHTRYDEYCAYLPGGKFEKIRNFNRSAVNKFVRILTNRADLVIAPSNDTKKYLERNGVRKPIVILPTGIKMEKRKGKLSKPKNKRPIILQVGRLCKERSISVLIRAFKEFQKKTDSELVIVSDGPEKAELEALVKKLGLEKKVRFTGFIPEKEKNRLYRKADVFVTPSTTDTQGLVMFEAMKYGTPVIASNKGGVKNYIINGKNGLLFNAGDVNDLKNKIARIINDKALKTRLSENGYEFVKNNDIQKYSIELQEIYRGALEKKISIIIPTYMEENYIKETLKSIKKQDYRDYEIIVVDSSSSDKTVQIARKYADKVIVIKERGIGLARNVGAKEASGDILLFLDADMVLKADYLRRVSRNFITKDIVGVSGYVKVDGEPEDKLVYLLTSEIAWLTTVIRRPIFYGMCMAWKKNVFEKVGGFNERFAVAEDIDLTKRMRRHGKCMLARDAVATTSARRLDKMGIFGAMKFHVLNYLRYRLFNDPYDYYPIAR